MKISRKSWHYRFIHWFWRGDYWWKTTSIYGYSTMFILIILFFPIYFIMRIMDYIIKWTEKPKPPIEFVD